ncbi:MAG TPA: carboxypeptidase-like regulatory domain-containing protein [Acidobacteriaceae bacterium]|nr:carboxypeptidase-like regulatory domain-containing protein [Acidobacteriaceae bacterium]
MDLRRICVSFSRRRAFSVLFALFFGLVGTFCSSRLLAQDSSIRIVQGKVVDKAGDGIKGATVYLKDSHTLSVKTYIAGNDGSYRFGQLAQSTDYSLWAENAGKKSSVKNISSFDTRKEFDITLKID